MYTSKEYSLSHKAAIKGIYSYLLMTTLLVFCYLSLVVSVSVREIARWPLSLLLFSLLPVSSLLARCVFALRELRFAELGIEKSWQQIARIENGSGKRLKSCCCCSCTGRVVEQSHQTSRKREREREDSRYRSPVALTYLLAWLVEEEEEEEEVLSVRRIDCWVDSDSYSWKTSRAAAALERESSSARYCAPVCVWFSGAGGLVLYLSFVLLSLKWRPCCLDQTLLVKNGKVTDW